MSGPISSPDLSPLNYHIQGNAGVYSQTSTKGKTVPEFKDVLELLWSAVLEKPIDNAVKDYCK